LAGLSSVDLADLSEIRFDTFEVMPLSAYRQSSLTNRRTWVQGACAAVATGLLGRALYRKSRRHATT